MAIEKIVGEIETFEHDFSRDIVTVGFTTGMAFFTPGYHVRKVADRLSPDRGAIYMKGLVATYELVDGRWELSRLEEAKK